VNWRLTLGLAVLVGLLLAVVLPALSAATPVRTSGAIAFARYRNANSPLREEIWVANPDGSGAHRIERAPANTLDGWPAWSPDGSRLLFSRVAPLNGSPGTGPNSIWSINRDGSQAHMLTPACKSPTHTPSASCPQDGQGSYSPDGQHIASLRFTGVPGIAIGNSNFRNVHEIFPFGDTRHAPDEDALAWSPDGTRFAIAVHNTHGDQTLPRNGRAIYVINLDGSGLHRLTPWKLRAGGIGELSWSPNGKHILFHTIRTTPQDPNLSTGNIYAIEPNGKGLHQVTRFSPFTGVQLGSYSPNSRQIVFSTDRDATKGPASSWPDVFVMNADGSHIHPITRTSNWEGNATWGR
jgi:TolB protein